MLPHDSERELGRQLPAVCLELANAFQHEWDAGRRPDIDTFLDANRSETGQLDEQTRRDFLVDLVKIDLSHRWRESAQAQTVIGDSASVQSGENRPRMP